MPPVFKAVCTPTAATYKTVDEAGIGKGKNNTVLMGSFVELLGDTRPGWVHVKAFSIEGWMEERCLGDSPGLKVFYVDVGQGDGALLEVGNDDQGYKILIDGGPGSNLARYLSAWQFRYYFRRNEQVHIHALFISHFDKDHYEGLIELLNDPRYTFGTLYHNGIAKFKTGKADRPTEYDSALGTRTKLDGRTYLSTTFDSLRSLTTLQRKGGLQELMERFVKAVQKAADEGRLQAVQRLDHRDGKVLADVLNGQPFEIEVLGPVTTRKDRKIYYRWFSDESHTVNGHSLVLKVRFGTRTLLFGGDLNTYSENHLMAHYGAQNPFEVDVAKSCHHGASEFTTDFMQAVNPFASVISSGDNESYAHPRADAIGCAGRYSRGDRPLVFSTELARSSNVATDKILYGLINLRTDGTALVMAQMKEASEKGEVWDLYDVDDR